MPVEIEVVNSKTTHNDICSSVIKMNREIRRRYTKITRSTKEASVCPTCGHITRLFYCPPISDADGEFGYIYCEYCGKPGKTRGKGWIYTLCDDCWDKKNKKS